MDQQRPPPLSVKQAAHQLGRSEKTIYRWIRKGWIEAARFGVGAKAHWVIEPAEVWRIKVEQMAPRLQRTYERVSEQIDDWHRAYGRDDTEVLRVVAYAHTRREIPRALRTELAQVANAHRAFLASPESQAPPMLPGFIRSHMTGRLQQVLERGAHGQPVYPEELAAWLQIGREMVKWRAKRPDMDERLHIRARIMDVLQRWHDTLEGVDEDDDARPPVSGKPGTSAAEP